MASFSKSKEARLVNHPSIIENAGMKFLIFDAPSDDNIDAYIEVRTNKHTSPLLPLTLLHFAAKLRSSSQLST